jgi:hypothetical protein
MPILVEVFSSVIREVADPINPRPLKALATSMDIAIYLIQVKDESAIRFFGFFDVQKSACFRAVCETTHSVSDPSYRNCSLL